MNVTLPPTFRPSECLCCEFGILIMWNDPDQPHIEKCDDCGFYDNDADAAKALEQLMTVTYQAPWPELPGV